MNRRSNQTGSHIDEGQIDRDLESINRLASLPWQRNLQNVEALIERLRVELILQDHRGSRKQFQRAVIDRLEDVLEERYDEENADRIKTRKSVLSYVRNLWDGLDTK